jgi:very-short-patch-repair endonuclease
MEEIWERARALRHAATDAERYLWRHLRCRRLAGFRFRRQYPIAGGIADFACVEARLLVELDGSQHLDRIHEDQQRTARLQRNGYRVVRFWNDDVIRQTEAVLEEILRHLVK